MRQLRLAHYCPCRSSLAPISALLDCRSRGTYTSISRMRNEGEGSPQTTKEMPPIGG